MAAVPLAELAPPTLCDQRSSYSTTRERSTGTAGPSPVLLEGPFCVIRNSRSGPLLRMQAPGSWRRESDKSLEHRPAHAERNPELLFKALIARLVLLELPPRLAVNREHHTASPTRDGIGIFGTQCVRQLIQQG